MQERILKIEGISKAYGSSKNKANDSVNASFKAGEIVALIGHNGAGKTTLINQIIGITKPDKGDITYFGKSFVQDTKVARSYVSIMPQLHAPISGVTVSQAITSIMRIKGINKKNIDIHLSNILQQLEIQQWKDTVGDKLSGGLRRLTSFAMTVASPSDIILLDEPTNDVDPLRRELMWNYLKQLKKKGHIIIIVTHNLLEVEQYADRYIMFNKGKIIKDMQTNCTLNEFATNLLTVQTKNLDITKDSTLPESLRVESLNDNKYAITVSNDQMQPIMFWLVQMLNEKKILNYKLSPTSLEDSYGGMLDE